MIVSIEVVNRIEKYGAQGGLDHTARLFLALASINHAEVKSHVERVALMSEATAKILQKDEKAAFFGGLLHDIGKIILPHELFVCYDITAEEYAKIKTHALAGFGALKDLHGFTALCAGLHHNLYQAGYGLTVQDFPKDWSPATIKKVLEISAIVSICDFVDAFTHRTTKIKDGSDKSASDLKTMLQAKYPNDHQVIDVVLEVAKQFQE